MNIANMSRSDRDRKLGGIFLVNGMVYSHTESNDEYMSGRRVLGEAWTEYSFPINGAVIDYSFPDMGYINYKSGVVYCIRKAARQYSMVYNQRVVEIVDPQQDLRRALNLQIDAQISMRPAFLKRLFDRTFFSYEQAIAKLRDGERIAAAINKHIAIAQSALLGGKFVIYYKNKVVGWVDVDGVPVLFREADYVAAACPFNVTIEDV